MNEKYEQYALQLKNQKLFEMEELYQKHLNDYIPLFQKHFLKVCENILDLQHSGLLGEISYLEYTLLYTNLLQKNETAEVRVYNDNWYFDGGQRIIGNFDFSYLFIKYRELWTELFSARKRFAGAVASHEIKSFLLSCARSFYRYVIAVCRFSILPCIESESFLSIRRTDEFEINIGEYMAYTEAIYKENRERTSKDALDWFSLRLEFEYAFEDFTELDFSGSDLSEIDLRYSDLRRSRLVHTDFQIPCFLAPGSVMLTWRALTCVTAIHEADFAGANLTNTRFTSAKSYAGISSGRTEWKIPGYRRVSFRNANLTNADFRKAKIRDADFAGATMDGTLFEKSRWMGCGSQRHKGGKSVLSRIATGFRNITNNLTFSLVLS